MTKPVFLLSLLSLIAILPVVLAQDLGSLDLSVRGSDIEPSVTLQERENRVVEEYRVNNNLYMIKITPSIGAPYYLVDEDGSGDMEWNRGRSELERNVPQWTLFSW